MRSSDNPRLATRRVRLAAVVLAVLAVLALLIGVAVLVADSPDEASTLRAADGGGAATSTTAAAVEPAPAESTTTTTVAPPTTAPKRSTTTTAAATPAPPPSQAYCGGWGGPGGPENVTPAGLVVTLTASAASVKRGDEVTFTVRAKNTTSKRVTHSRGAHNEPITVHMGTDVVWMRTWNQAAPAVVLEETFEPGEEKVSAATWKTDQVCDQEGGGFKTVALQPGRYTVESDWNHIEGGGAWPADPVEFDITP